jgi:hypothetical protein
MNRCVPAEMPRLCVEKLRNSGLLRALFALIRNISSRHALDLELITDSLTWHTAAVPLKIKLLGASSMPLLRVVALAEGITLADEPRPDRGHALSPLVTVNNTLANS